MTATTDTSHFLRAEAELVITQARKDKAECIKDLGDPITLAGKALALRVRGQHAWIAENTAVVRVVDLETGKTVQLYKGHTAPVTSLELFERDGKTLLISGSWDKTIKIWDTTTKALLSSTDAHADFVKALLAIPKLGLLVSGSSDKIVRFWDLASLADGQPLRSAGSIAAHTRPVECFAADKEGTLFTADTMGQVKVWSLKPDEGLREGEQTRWRASLQSEMAHHRTRVDDLHYGAGMLWTASTDDTVQIAAYPPQASHRTLSIVHPHAVRCVLPLLLTPLGEPYVLTGAGDVIRAYEISDLESGGGVSGGGSGGTAEALGSVDGHWHDVTALELWVRRAEGGGGRGGAEAWVVSASLDGTIRKWRLADLLTRPSDKGKAEGEGEAKAGVKKEAEGGGEFGLSEEEERELAELMMDD